MSTSGLAIMLYSRLLAIQNAYPKVKIFVFGSFLDNSSAPSDVDILAVYDTKECPTGLRDEVKRLDKLHPVHLLIMSNREEEQFQFIVSQGAVFVGQLAEGELPSRT